METLTNHNNETSGSALTTVAVLQEQPWISLHGFVYSLQEKNLFLRQLIKADVLHV